MGLADGLVKKFWGVLQGLIKKYTDFIKLPNALALVGAAANKVLDKILDYLKDLLKKNIAAIIAAGTDALLAKIFTDPYNPTDDQIEEYVSKHRGLQRVLAYAGNDLSESISGDIVLACTDPEYSEDVFNRTLSSTAIPEGDISGDDFIAAVFASSDFDDKVSGYGKTLHNAQDLLKDIKGVLPWVFLVYTIVLKVKEWLSQNKNPSKFRGKYISRLIRIAAALMKEAATNTKDAAGNLGNSIKGLIASLKSIDTAIAAVTLAYAIYEKNRRDLQKASEESFIESVYSITCTVAPPAPPVLRTLSGSLDLSLDLSLNLSSFSCPVSLDDYISPKEPIEEKILSFSCPIDGEDTYSPVLPDLGQLAPLLQTRAIIASLKTGSTFSPLPEIEKGSLINPGTPIFSDGKDLVLSSISGTVSQISRTKKEIFIEDAVEDPLPVEEDIKTLMNLYRDLIDVDDTLDKWYIRTILPSMIAASPLLDPSISATEGYSLIYLTGGLEPRSDAAKKDQESAKKIYDKDSEEATEGKRIKKMAEKGEDMSSVKNAVNKIKGSYYKSLKTIGDRAIYEAQRTVTDKKSLAMIDWYLLLYTDILSTREDDKSLEYKRNTPVEDQISAGVVSPYLIELESKVASILAERILVDSSRGSAAMTKIEPKIEDLSKTLNKGAKTPAIPSPYKSYPEWYNGEYKKSTESGKSAKKALESISGILEGLGKGNSSLSNPDKIDLRWRIYKLFELSQEISTQVSKGFSTTETVESLTRKEGSYFTSYFSALWKKKSEIPKSIGRIEASFESGVGRYLPSLRITRDGEDLLYFPLSEAIDCPEPSIDPELSPYTSTDWDDKKYWVKYCAFATLASVLSPPWGLGIPPPQSIPLPTVYIPIKALRTSWGITLIGLTITGIWIFPFILVVNQDILHHVPFTDPATAVKKTADRLKKGLNKRLKAFRTETLKVAYEKVADRVAELKALVDKMIAEKRELLLTKPKRDRAAESLMTGKEKREALALYLTDLAKWTEDTAIKSETILQTKKDLFIEEKKAQMIARAMRGSKIEIDVGVPDAVLSSVEKIEASIDKAFAAIVKLVDSIDPLLALLPRSAKPEQSYFGFTLKNPKPLQKIGKGVPEVAEELLQKLQAPFELNRADLMSSGFKSKLTTSYLNGKLVAKTIAAAMPVIIPYDPYPPYEKLKATNVAWTIGYLPQWGNTGNAQYGFPGFGRFPIIGD